MERNPAMMLQALQGYKRKPMPNPMEQAEEEDVEEAEGMPMEDPRDSNKDGTTLYLDEDLFPEGCKVGKQVKIIATVTSMGTKIGVTPDEVEPYNVGEMED